MIRGVSIFVGVLMNYREWRPEEKFAIVVEALKGQCPIAEICPEHQMSKILY